MELKQYEAPMVEVLQIKQAISVLNFLSTGGYVNDLELGDGELISDEWDEFVD